MKLSASNIGWKKEFDNEMYAWMAESCIEGLEIAPTRIFPENPYDMKREAGAWAEQLKSVYKFEISSMQSIWYGRSENIFSSKEEREILFEYTKQAIDFASVIECGNLVFGCPRNRSFSEGADISVAEEFFGRLGDYAYLQGTVLAMEANPTIYNTNYCNRTNQAFELVKRVASKGFKVNLDVGTMIANEEGTDLLYGQVDMINHVHISEPGLALPERRGLHDDLAVLLLKEEYNGFISLETKTQNDIVDVKSSMEYISSVYK